MNLFFLLILKHFIVDFILQTKYQWANKSKFLHPGGILHASLHGVFSYFILFNINLSLFDAISHYFIDFFKSNIIKKFNLNSNDYIFWVLTGFDQFLHYLVYLIIIWNINSNLINQIMGIW